MMEDLDVEDTIADGKEMYEQVEVGEVVAVFPLEEGVESVVLYGEVCGKEVNVLMIDDFILQEKHGIRSDGDCIRFVTSINDDRYGKLGVIVDE